MICHYTSSSSINYIHKRSESGVLKDVSSFNKVMRTVSIRTLVTERQKSLAALALLNIKVG